ncbi:MAG TPA: hypothetical protein VGF55_01730 [Gemmataceae bacterium]
MTRLAVYHPVGRHPTAGGAAGAILPAAVAVAVGSALLAGWAPVRFSIVTVFLFAGPHNWLEARYFLTRLPARWGRLRPFFVTGIGGALALAAAYAALPWLADRAGWGPDGRSVAAAAWATALIGWVAALVQMRSRTNPRRDWSWTLPVAVALVGFGWLRPAYVFLGLIYLHPFIALWLLDRELRRSKPHWLGPYRRCLACLPVLLAVLWWQLAATPDLLGDDGLTARITGHAGAGVLPGVSTHVLVATHAFLEMLHYGVWVLAIPLAGLRAAPWALGDVPLARRAPSWRVGVAAVLVGGAAVVLALWAGFAADYVVTRDVYFTVALVHVLAEAPFLIRSL